MRHAGRVKHAQRAGDGSLEFVEQHLEEASIALLRREAGLEVGLLREDDVRHLPGARCAHQNERVFLQIVVWIDGIGFRLAARDALFLDPAFDVGHDDEGADQGLWTREGVGEFGCSLFLTLAAFVDEEADLGQRNAEHDEGGDEREDFERAQFLGKVMANSWLEDDRWWAVDVGVL
jgi:hypothetical protein